MVITLAAIATTLFVTMYERFRAEPLESRTVCVSAVGPATLDRYGRARAREDAQIVCGVLLPGSPSPSPATSGKP